MKDIQIQIELILLEASTIGRRNEVYVMAQKLQKKHNILESYMVAFEKLCKKIK